MTDHVCTTDGMLGLGNSDLTREDREYLRETYGEDPMAGFMVARILADMNRRAKDWGPPLCERQDCEDGWIAVPEGETCTVEPCPVCEPHRRR